MQDTDNEFNNIREDSLDQNQHLQKLFLRILPYWPFIILAILIGFLASRIYLRYASKVYAINSRVIVNDDSQQKAANLVDIVQLDTRNMSVETEKQMAILGSRELLGELVKKLQLNVQYGYSGLIKSFQNFNNMPFSIELEAPDSVSQAISGDVQIVDNKIRFNNVEYPCDTFVHSEFGDVKWHVNSENIKRFSKADWNLKIEPIAVTVTELQKALTIVPISKQSSILSITYLDELPKRGVVLLTNLLSLYGTSAVDYKSRISENTLHFIEGRLKIVANELGDIEKNLQEFKTRNNIVDLSDQNKAILNLLGETDSKISDFNVEMDVLNQVQDYVISRNNTKSKIPTTLGLDDPVLMSLLNQLFQAEFQLQTLQQTSGSKNPNIEVLQETINKLKPSILLSVNNLKSGIRVSIKSLEADNAKINGTLNKMPVKERQLLDITRQQDIKSGIYTFLLQKKEEASINAAGIVPNYRILDKPESSGVVEPLPSRVYGISFLITLILLIIFIYIKEFSSTRIKFRSQIEGRTKVPIIAELAYQPNKTDSPIVVEEGKRTLIAEEFRELRTNFSYITFNSEGKSKVILITSSIPNEGKSFVAINTSISLCLTGLKVVLLEFDLRKPKISKELGITNSTGLSSFLIGNAAETDIVKNYPGVTNLFVIPSGPIPPNPSELISSTRLNDLFKYLKSEFDYIIIDSPPVGSVTDAKILARISDATLYLVRQNYTHISFVELINDLRQRGILPNLNIVFNGLRMKTIPGYKYGNAYGYGGYGYGYGYNYDVTERSNNKGVIGWFKRLWQRLFSKKSQT